MDEFRYGDWLLVLGLCWFGLRFLTAAVSILISPRGFVPRAPNATEAREVKSERHDAGN